MTRLSILLSAYACEPGRGSEHGVGWNWARELARVADVCVLTRQARRPAIEAWEREHGPLGVRWAWHDPSPRIERIARRAGGLQLFYRVWQRSALGVARRLHAEVGFDLVHHLTMNAFREPGWLWTLPIAFVWGPIGGAQNAPRQLLIREDRRVRMAEWCRGTLNRLIALAAPRPSLALRRSALVLCANRDALAWARGAGRRDAVLMLEAGIDAADRVERQPDPEGRILWIGSDDARKNPRFALAAFATARRWYPRLSMTMIGLSMNARVRLEMWAARHGVPMAGIEIHPSMPRNQLEPHWSTATQFWFTSWRDTSGNVLLEALAREIPCMAFAHQGAIDILADGAGLLVPVAEDALERWTMMASGLIERPDLAQELAARGHRLARERFTWTAKITELSPALARLGVTRRDREGGLPVVSETGIPPSLA